MLDTHVKGGELALEFPLGGGDALVLSAQLIELFVCVTEFLFSLATTAVSLFQKSSRLLEFVLQGIGTTFRDTKLFTGIITGTLFLFQCGLNFLQLLLVALDVLLCLGVSLIK
jgi:hypothetical protein